MSAEAMALRIGPHPAFGSSNRKIAMKAGRSDSVAPTSSRTVAATQRPR